MEEVMLRNQKNQEVSRLKKQVREIESKVEEIASMEREVKMQCKADVKKEVDKVLPTAVEHGLRDLPFEMVCAFENTWSEANSVIIYDR